MKSFSSRRLPLGLALALAVSVLAACRQTARQSISFQAPPAIDHILFEVKDMDRSLKFYRDYFGFTVKSQSRDFVFLHAANVDVGLWTKHWDWSPAPNDHRTPQGMYPHLAVPDTHALMDRLSKAGYRVVAPAKDYSYGTEGFVADPDGFVWAVITPK